MSKSIVAGVSMYTDQVQSLDKVEGEEKIGQIQWSWIIETNKGIGKCYKTISQYQLTAQTLISSLHPQLHLPTPEDLK